MQIEYDQRVDLVGLGERRINLACTANLNDINEQTNM